MLIRSGALDILVIDSGRRAGASGGDRGRDGRQPRRPAGPAESQALRKITGALSNSNTTAIFINQLREKIGVMFGCFNYTTRIQLADGTTEKIGKIVTHKMDVEVLSYDAVTDQIVPRRW